MLTQSWHLRPRSVERDGEHRSGRPSAVRGSCEAAAASQGPSGTVVVTGVFDLLHVGHLRFLRSARAAGSRLLVGVEDDLRTAARKGACRPVVPLGERCEMLAALEPVDGVFSISGSAEPALAPAYARLLAPLRPSVLAFTEGDAAEAGRRLVAEWLGCSLLVAPRIEGRSTTLLVERAIEAAGPPAAGPLFAQHPARR
ncbi:MAG: adenylyltransferase/cytidyltransferase family protein [Solirubrobacteraceae bacterium]